MPRRKERRSAGLSTSSGFSLRLARLGASAPVLRAGGGRRTGMCGTPVRKSQSHSTIASASLVPFTPRESRRNPRGSGPPCHRRWKKRQHRSRRGPAISAPEHDSGGVHSVPRASWRAAHRLRQRLAPGHWQDARPVGHPRCARPAGGVEGRRSVGRGGATHDVLHADLAFRLVDLHEDAPRADTQPPCIRDTVELQDVSGERVLSELADCGEQSSSVARRRAIEHSLGAPREIDVPGHARIPRA